MVLLHLSDFSLQVMNGIIFLSYISKVSFFFLLYLIEFIYQFISTNLLFSIFFFKVSYSHN